MQVFNEINDLPLHITTNIVCTCARARARAPECLLGVDFIEYWPYLQNPFCRV